MLGHIEMALNQKEALFDVISKENDTLCISIEVDRIKEIMSGIYINRIVQNGLNMKENLYNQINDLLNKHQNSERSEIMRYYSQIARKIVNVHESKMGKINDGSLVESKVKRKTNSYFGDEKKTFYEGKVMKNGDVLSFDSNLIVLKPLKKTASVKEIEKRVLIRLRNQKTLKENKNKVVEKNHQQKKSFVDMQLNDLRRTTGLKGTKSMASLHYKIL